jgi:DNA-binding MarR family transcriptional regulator
MNEDLINEHIGKWIAMVHLTSLNYLDRVIDRFGLSQATFGFLVSLYQNDGQRQDQLFREISVNKSTVARAVQKLAKLGYVRREPEKTDRRVVRVFLTPKALEI